MPRRGTGGSRKLSPASGGLCRKTASIFQAVGLRVVEKGRRRGGMRYRCEATTVEGFVQQLAVSYLRHGYWFYVAGCVPAAKDPSEVDCKLIDRYGIDLTKHERAARKRKGLANLQYLRFGRFFLLLSTYGEHRFFAEEAAIRDARRQPIAFAGYSISHRVGKSCVRIEPNEYRELKRRMLQVAGELPVGILEREFRRLPFEPYAPVRKQLLAIYRAVNGRRAETGLSRIAIGCVRMKRRIYRPFAPWEEREGRDGVNRLRPPSFRRDDWARR
jgi:hypothetical protein